MPQHVVALALLVRADRVLLVHRHPSRRWYPDCWDLPGGHLEPGEDARDAARRECREELGVEVVRLPALDVASSDPDVQVHAFLVTEWSGEPRNVATDEHDRISWFRPDELGGLHLADPAVIPVVSDVVTPRPDDTRQ